MLTQTEDTIVAIASGLGGAERGVIRLSGPQSLEIARKICHPWREVGATLPPLSWDVEIHAKLAKRLDSAVNDHLLLIPGHVIVWAGARCYTREPTVELHTIGSAPLLQAILEQLCEDGARLALPGEFTFRAFMAGRLDLTQAEAVLGVIDSETKAELSNSLTQLAGGLSKPLAELRDRLLNLLADIEAGLDFVDEDIAFISRERVLVELDHAIRSSEEIERRLRVRDFRLDAPKVVLVGRPNVGKSSLFNALVQRNGADLPSVNAIVTDEPGTTRDFLIAPMRAEDVDFLLVDTAGIEESESRSHDPHGEESPRQLAQRQSSGQREQADLQLLCLECDRDLDDWERSQLASGAESTIVVRTKADRHDSLATVVGSVPSTAMLTSVRTGRGITELTREIARRLRSPHSTSDLVVTSTAIRCRESVRSMRESLESSRALAMGAGDELVASQIREALGHLGLVTGEVITDDILDRVFSRFCIGK